MLRKKSRAGLEKLRLTAPRAFYAHYRSDGVAIALAAPQPEAYRLASAFHHVAEDAELRSRAILENHLQAAITVEVGQRKSSAVIREIQTYRARDVSERSVSIVRKKDTPLVAVPGPIGANEFVDGVPAFLVRSERNAIGRRLRDDLAPEKALEDDPSVATLSELLQAPILFINGHRGPQFTPDAKQNLLGYVQRGGCLFAEACCGKPEFDDGFRRLMKEVFPDEESRIRPLPPEHPIWRAKHLLEPSVHPLWGIRRGDKTVVVYSPMDLSCYWNQAKHHQADVAVVKAMKVGENVIEYLTDHKLPADKLAFP